MDLDDAYANAAHIPGGADYPPRWAAEAARFRATTSGETDLAYGAGPRNRFDLFHPDGTPAGLVVFVHGGFWRAFDKSSWSHFAAGPLRRGWAVAVPSYTLAPEARIATITREVAAAIDAAAARVAGPVRLTGHSAGGHLVARALCPDTALSAATAARLVRVVAISPLADLTPFPQTEMNADFRLDAAEAAAESPVRHPEPAHVPVTVWVGGAERPAFLDQARGLSAAWPAAMLTVAPDKHHFNVIDGLRTAESDLTTALLE